MPKDGARQTQGAVVAFMGRVPVHVHGDAPVNSFLIPSGLSDGRSRAVSAQELRDAPYLRAQCFGVVWEQLPPDASGRPCVLAFVSAHPLKAFGEYKGVIELAPLGSSSVPAPRCAREPRPYQKECIEQALTQNTVINLPTGAGKTLIAVKIIDHFRSRCPDKRVLFAVPNVALVRQQARARRPASPPAYTHPPHHMRAHSRPLGLPTPLCPFQADKIREDGLMTPRVAELHGGTIKGWGRVAWKACLRQNDVLLGTPAAFYNAMHTQGLLSLSDFSLIVFDECHEATGNSPMACIMTDVFHPARQAGRPCPHVLGLTASIIAGKLNDMAASREQLEVLLQSTIFSPDVSGFNHNVTYHKIDYPRDSINGHEELVSRKVEELASTFEDITRVEFDKATKHALHVGSECGMAGFMFFLGEALTYQLEVRANMLKAQADRSRGGFEHSFAAKARELSVKLPQLRESYRQAAETLRNDGQLTNVPMVSGKCRTLLDLLTHRFVAHADDPQYKGLIFVQQVALGPPLAEMINQHFATMPLSNVRALAISGVGSMSDAVRTARLAAFERGEVQILVCTNAIEQGTDVQDCEFVVRYSKFDTTKSHVQGSGRARKNNAEIFYFENDPVHETEAAQQLRALARDASVGLSPVEQLSRIELHEVPGFYPYQPNGASGATVNLHNCAQIFHEYCSKVLSQSLNLQELYHYQVDVIRNHAPEKREVLCAVHCPTPEGYRTVSLKDVETHWGDVTREQVMGSSGASKSRKEFDKSRFLYTVVVRMYEDGYLDAQLEASARALAGTRAAVDAQKLPDQVTLGDAFAPLDEDVGGVRFAAWGTTSTWELTGAGRAQAEANYVSPPPAARPSHDDAKSRLGLLAMQEWRQPNTAEVIDYQTAVTGLPPAQIFIATVTLPLCQQSFTGYGASTRRGAEQSAAALAVAYMEQVARATAPPAALPPSAALPSQPSALTTQPALAQPTPQPLPQPPPAMPPPPPSHWLKQSQPRGQPSIRPPPLYPQPTAAPPPQQLNPPPQQPVQPPPSNTNAKTQLDHLAKIRWKTNQSALVVYDTRVDGQPPLQRFTSTVTLVRCNRSFTGYEASTKKGAEQLAATLAVAYMEHN